MKHSTFIQIVLGGLLVAVAVTGCKRRPDPPLTRIPGSTRSIPGDTDGADGAAARLVNANENVTTTPLNPGDGNLLPLRPGEGEFTEDRETFKASTVYFEFDRANVKPSERSKFEAVALALKAKAGAQVRVEGHCDERGTEEYNRSLGERRALSIRETLQRLGIEGRRIHTITFGEDKPADPSHSEAAWAKNRRGEFVLLSPK